MKGFYYKFFERYLREKFFYCFIHKTFLTCFIGFLTSKIKNLNQIIKIPTGNHIEFLHGFFKKLLQRSNNHTCRTSSWNRFVFHWNEFFQNFIYRFLDKYFQKKTSENSSRYFWSLEIFHKFFQDFLQEFL